MTTNDTLLDPLHQCILAYVRKHDGWFRLSDIIAKLPLESAFTRDQIRDGIWQLADWRIVRFDRDWKVTLP